MANKPPQPRILQPSDKIHIVYGQLLNLAGEANDAQDGSVASNNLVWSTAQGQLGTGSLLTATDLRVGANVITLTATDSAGLSAQTSITVYVDDDLSLPGPTLSVAPTEVAWHVAPGTTAAQTADLDVGNAGSGSLAWHAASDATWLTLSPATGTETTALTLSANPSGLAAGTVLNAHVTVTVDAVGDQPAQSAVVPVTLSVGRIDQPVLPPRQRDAFSMFLPLTRR